MPVSVTAISASRAKQMPALPGERDVLLAALLDNSQLSSPPALAMQIVRAASHHDCNPGEIVALLKQDPVLCAKLLKVVNSSIYGFPRPIASMNQAVLILGLNTLRSLVLGMSIPVMQGERGKGDKSLQEFWITSFSGALIARELAVRMQRPAPDSDMVAGLLRDLGSLLVQRSYPEAWRTVQARPADHLLRNRCEIEEEVFGVNHALASPGANGRSDPAQECCHDLSSQRSRSVRLPGHGVHSRLLAARSARQGQPPADSEARTRGTANLASPTVTILTARQLIEHLTQFDYALAIDFAFVLTNR